MTATPKFFQPHSLEEALSLLAHHGREARLVAGGTALVPRLRARAEAPAALISLARVPGLDRIEADGGGLRIGALATLQAVARSPLAAERAGLLAAAAAEAGGPRLRHQATLGGCLADADYASDPPAALLALDASVELRGPAGARARPVAELLLGHRRTSIAPDECLTAVIVPPQPAGAAVRYLKATSRAGKERPTLAVAALALVEGGLIRELRVAVGAGGHAPARLPAVEAAAAGRPPDEATARAVAEAYAEAVATVDDLAASAWYRTELIRVYVRRAVLQLAPNAYA